MKGAIVYKGEKNYTFLKKIFNSINNVQKDFNWLITSHECYPMNEQISNILSSKWCWLTGEELTKIIDEEDFQWIWGCLVAFPKEISLEEIFKYDFPSAGKNNNLWNKPLSMQHPLSEIELIAWDSSMTVLICRNDKLIDIFMNNIPLAENLEQYNEKNRNKK